MSDANHGIDLLLTGDGTLTFEQSLAGFHLSVVALSAIQLPIIRQHLAKIIAAIDSRPRIFPFGRWRALTRKKPPGI